MDRVLPLQRGAHKWESDELGIWIGLRQSCPCRLCTDSLYQSRCQRCPRTQTNLRTSRIVYANNTQPIKCQPYPIGTKSKSASLVHSLLPSKLNLSPPPQLSVIIFPLPPKSLLVHSPSILPQSFNPLLLFRCLWVISTDSPFCSRLQHPVAR
jgi:hypothetical protein